MSSQETFMRYLYIICLVLSSFFIYNLSSADNIERQYAFFVPGNAYEKNTMVNNLNSIQPRYKKKQPNAKPTQSSISKKQKNKIKTAEKSSRPVTEKPLKEIADTKSAPQIKTQETPIVAEQTNAVNEETSTITTTETSVTSTPVVETPATPQLSEEELNKIKEKAAQYNIDEDDFIISPSTEYASQDKEKSISGMLSEIPYPNPDEPSFKQAFGKYGIALRALYRQKTLPKDYEQDRILAKANSIKRFKVEVAD